MPKNSLLTTAILTLLSVSTLLASGAKFIWWQDSAEARNEYVYFRNQFELKSPVIKADIYLFADSRYHLLVNGIFVNFGPARSYPAHPEYDRYDISRYLKKGKNVIDVKALYNGIENFQIPNNRPGFIAWGVVQTKKKQISLDTPGNWFCRPAAGYDKNAVRFSFACGAMEVYDARKEKIDSSGRDSGGNGWEKPVVILNQQAWGKLSPRSIPPLTQTEYTVKNTLGLYTFNTDEDIYSFRVKTPDERRIDYNRGWHIVGYTYIYSPRQQDVLVGLWWGEFYLNGQGPLEGIGASKNRINRNPRLLKLKKGWNFFNMHYGGIWGAWDFYMAVPKEAGLVISAEKKRDSEVVFMTAGPGDGLLDKKLAEMDQPFASEDEMLAFYPLKWKTHRRGEGTNNPALDMVWYAADSMLEHPQWQTENIVISDTNGQALVFDMGRKILGRIFIEIEAPAGTIIDFGISEDLKNGKPWLFKRQMISAGIRFIADGATERFETFKPYGFRYMQVNIRQNKEPVRIKRLGAVEQIYPFEKLGRFECSDPMLNAIWEMGWRTLRVCAEDSYIDTPFRERAMYAGDMLPEYAITLAGSSDSRLVKRTLKVFHDKYHNAMYGNARASESEYPLINILIAKWYFDYTGDIELIRYLYDGYKALLKKG